MWPLFEHFSLSIQYSFYSLTHLQAQPTSAVTHELSLQWLFFFSRLGAQLHPQFDKKTSPPRIGGCSRSFLLLIAIAQPFEMVAPHPLLRGF